MKNIYTIIKFKVLFYNIIMKKYILMLFLLFPVFALFGQSHTMTDFVNISDFIGLSLDKLKIDFLQDKQHEIRSGWFGIQVELQDYPYNSYRTIISIDPQKGVTEWVIVIQRRKNTENIYNEYLNIFIEKYGEPVQFKGENPTTIENRFSKNLPDNISSITIIFLPRLVCQINWVGDNK